MQSRTKHSREQTTVENKLMMTWGASNPAVHTQNNFTFGHISKSSDYFPSTIQMIAHAAEMIDNGTVANATRCAAPQCRSSLKFGVITTDASWGALMTEGAMAEIARLNLDSVPCTTVPYFGYTYDEIKEELRHLRRAGVNVLLSLCTYVV